METVLLPTISIPVPPLAIGAMFWGTRVPTSTAHELLDQAVDAGACFLDTANNYPFWETGGFGDESETCVGAWFATRGPAARDRVVLASKIGARPTVAGGDFASVCGLSRSAVLEQVAGSLRRLGTDHLDLLYAHIDDRAVPLAETVGALQEVVDRGWARAIAGSNLDDGRLTEALRAAGDGPRYVALQNRFTLLSPDPDADLGPQVLLDDDVQRVCTTEQVAMVAYSTLLEGAYTRADRPVPADYGRPGTARALATLTEVADQHGLDAGQTVLSWLVSRPDPVIPVVGVSRPAQLESAVAAVSTRLGDDAVARLDEARRLAR